jgi:hypothetical protein
MQRVRRLDGRSRLVPLAPTRTFGLAPGSPAPATSAEQCLLHVPFASAPALQPRHGFIMIMPTQIVND